MWFPCFRQNEQQQKKGSFGSIEEGKRAKLPIRGTIRNIHYLLLRFFAFALGASLRLSILLAAGTSERAWCFATRIRALSDQEREARWRDWLSAGNYCPERRRPACDLVYFLIKAITTIPFLFFVFFKTENERSPLNVLHSYLSTFPFFFVYAIINTATDKMVVELWPYRLWDHNSP